jgi:ligand-binding SRPBCC domain-containing protein
VGEDPLKKFHLSVSCFIPAKIEDVWTLAADPQHLVALTPKFYGLFLKERSQILEGERIRMALGIQQLNLNIEWTALIEKVQALGAKRYFIDLQEKGPFESWRHEHLFEEVRGGVRIEDKVSYSLPMTFLKGVHPALNLWVKPSMIFLFKERQRRMKAILEKKSLGYRESFA